MYASVNVQANELLPVRYTRLSSIDALKVRNQLVFISLTSWIFNFKRAKIKKHQKNEWENKRLQRFFHFTIILNFVWNSTKISNILKFKPLASLLTQRQFAASVVSIFMPILFFSKRNRFLPHRLNVSILQSMLIKFRSIYDTILWKFKRKFFTYLNWVIQLGDSHGFLFTHIEWLASY